MKREDEEGEGGEGGEEGEEGETRQERGMIVSDFLCRLCAAIAVR